ncbi:MAG: hypothetical protein IK127_09325 [Clostridia bacterium]|nr:hypothetical protein [Clostridia bacterium]
MSEQTSLSKQDLYAILMTKLKIALDKGFKMYPGKWTDEIVTIPFCGQMKK